MVSCPLATAGMNVASGFPPHHCTIPAVGTRLMFAFVQGILAQVVQTITLPPAQRNRVVPIATPAGKCSPNALLTAGTRSPGMGRVVSSVPTRLQNVAGVSASTGTAIPQQALPWRRPPKFVWRHTHCEKWRRSFAPEHRRMINDCRDRRTLQGCRASLGRFNIALDVFETADGPAVSERPLSLRSEGDNEGTSTALPPTGLCSDVSCLHQPCVALRTRPCAS